ncbi:MAG TPA: Fur family transcriptional regulator [Candidatus Dormibacteraeota bacterium]|nr:Fur family transcriptional regulator [Candidatus Dormibacteraeota bacterium]
MGDATVLLDALDHGGYRLTVPRREVAALIAIQGGPFSASDLVETARRRGLGLGRATIFRTLETLTILGAVERLDLPSGEHAYVACEPAHHHHLVCSSCGRSVEVVDDDLDVLVRRIGRRSGFRIDSHRFELFGLCRTCRRTHS